MTKHILLTRPQRQNQELEASLQQQGYSCEILPSIIIEAAGDQTQLQHGLAQLKHSEFVIVTSSNAITQLNNHDDLLNNNAQFIAVGPASAQSLRAIGIDNVIVPEHFSSEGILKLALWEAQSNVSILTGEAPKPTLKQDLLAQGCEVNEIFCYRRRCPVALTQTEANELLQKHFDAIICLSYASLNNLASMLKPHAADWLAQQKVLIVSERMQELAAKLGINHFIKLQNPSTDEILRVLIEPRNSD